MPGQLSKEEKEARARRAIALAAEMEQSWLESRIGRTVPVLFEEEKDGWWQGHAPDYALVRAKGEQLHDRVLPVRIEAVERGALTGRIQ